MGNTENWVTINGNHVLINEKGVISKGPKSMVGKTVKELKSGSNKNSKVKSAKANGESKTTNKSKIKGVGKTASNKGSESKSQNRKKRLIKPMNNKIRRHLIMLLTR